jgi:hypothetical protein
MTIMEKESDISFIWGHWGARRAFSTCEGVCTQACWRERCFEPVSARLHPFFGRCRSSRASQGCIRAFFSSGRPGWGQNRTLHGCRPAETAVQRAFLRVTQDRVHVDNAVVAWVPKRAQPFPQLRRQCGRAQGCLPSLWGRVCVRCTSCKRPPGGRLRSSQGAHQLTTHRRDLENQPAPYS